jgi:hypothetical protein
MHSPRNPAPITVGDTNRGFEASIDHDVARLHVRLWGVWDVSIVTQFVAAVETLGTQLAEAPWTSLVDARKFGVQSPELEPLRQKSLDVASRLGCTRMAVVVQSSVYALQFRRLASQGHLLNQSFPDMSSALKWLNGADPSSRRRPNP